MNPRHYWTTSVALFGLLCIATTGCSNCKSVSPQPGVKKGSTAQQATASNTSLSIIDSHVHITPHPDIMNVALQIFSEANVVKFAAKSAGIPGSLRYDATLKLADILGDRMAYFTNLDWDDIDDPGWGKREADRMEQAMREGASGIKIFKALGLGVRLKDDTLLRIDDKRLEPIWQRAAKVGAIVAWHVADPVAFFEPINEKNERYDELSLAPEWSFFGEDYPGHDELLAQRDKIVVSHPKTTFLGIHLANHPEDLDYVDRLLDRCPNLYVDIAARLPEIGRHPVDKVRTFFIKHQKRILFGTDFIVTPKGFQLGSLSEYPPDIKDSIKFFADHRRFFETADRNIDHPTPIQGRWKINAINLPTKVLKKIYHDNAQRLIFDKREAWLKAQDAKKKSGGGAKP
jgi:predicted TIM-barrel fold metal-dependent hydrolase